MSFVVHSVVFVTIWGGWFGVHPHPRNEQSTLPNERYNPQKMHETALFPPNDMPAGKNFAPQPRPH